MKFVEAMTFCMENEKAVARHSWRDTLFIVVMPELLLPPFNTQGTSRKVNDRTAKWIGPDTELNCRPYFSAYKDGNRWQPGWTPDTEDCFADDWYVVPDYEFRESIQKTEKSDDY